MQEPSRAAAGRSTGTLADRVRQAAADQSDRPALISADRAVTWRQLDRLVDALAAWLAHQAPAASAGPPGYPARVVIALPNSVDFAVAFFAVLRAGLVAVPANPASAAPELRHVLADSEASLLFGTDRVGQLVDELCPGLPALTAVHRGLPAGIADPDRQAGLPAGALPAGDAGRPGLDDLALLLYTAGTEGQPKGAMLTHRALLANHEQVGRVQPPVVGPDDTVLLALPFFHAYGLNSGLAAVAYHGACGVLVDRFDPAEALALIARHEVSVVAGVPSMFLDWSLLPESAAAMASVRVAVSGAAPLEPGTAARFTAATGHPVGNGYGLTEAAPVLTSTLASPVPKAGSIGRPIPGVTVRLLADGGEELWNSADTGAAGMPDDPGDWELDLESAGTDPGQLVVRGANLFAGYWPGGHGGPDPQGWWATGDIGYADADGDLFLVDRLGELILVNGFNVYPREVELVLDAHPGVAESAVVGGPHPHTGQTVRAYVVRSGAAPVRAEELLAHCERRLARFKCPTAVEFVEALPHSAIGKVRKTLLRAEPATGSAVPAPRPEPAQPTEVPDVP